MNHTSTPIASNKLTNFGLYINLNTTKRKQSIVFNTSIPITSRNQLITKGHTKNSFSTEYPTPSTPAQKMISLYSSVLHEYNNGIECCTTPKKRLLSKKSSAAVLDSFFSEQKLTLNTNEIMSLSKARDKDINHSASSQIAHIRFMDYCNKMCTNGCLIFSEVHFLYSSICQLIPYASSRKYYSRQLTSPHWYCIT